MKKLTTKNYALLFILTIFCGLSSVFAQKISVEEIVSKHLDSIAEKNKRLEIKNQLIVSNVELVVKGTTRPTDGRAVILSEGTKSLWGMNFNSNDYPQDRFGFNGKDVRVGYSKPGIRSILGGFIFSYEDLLKEGLLGGTLLSSWTLNDISLRTPKLASDGTKKINGKESYAISYSPKNGSDLSIKMYFEKDTYRHLRTEYSRVIAARQGAGIDNSAGQGSDRYSLIEDFSDFQKVNSVTIPKVYKISYKYTGNSSTQLSQNTNRELQWVFNITNLSLNQQLDSESFNIDAK